MPDSESSTKQRTLNIPMRAAPAFIKHKHARMKLSLLRAIVAGGVVCGALLMLLAVPVHVHLRADSVADGNHNDWRTRREVEILSSKPRAYYVKNFLPEAECEYLIQLAAPTMEKSRVVDHRTGGTKRSSARTSTGTFLPRDPDDVVQAIEQRIAEVTMVPLENQEAFYILHYHDGQKYEPHHDYFREDFVRKDSGGQRVVTVLMYLSTPDEGGETVFPDADRKVKGPGWSKCALEGLAVKAKRGDALVFWSLNPDGSLDPASLHGSCPTLKGDKWTATKWIHVSPYHPMGKLKETEDNSDACVDERSSCSAWAAKGECEKNSGFMTKHCKESCGLCKPAPAKLV